MQVFNLHLLQALILGVGGVLRFRGRVVEFNDLDARGGFQFNGGLGLWLSCLKGLLRGSVVVSVPPLLLHRLISYVALIDCLLSICCDFLPSHILFELIFFELALKKEFLRRLLIFIGGLSR